MQLNSTPALRKRETRRKIKHECLAHLKKKVYYNLGSVCVVFRHDVYLLLYTLHSTNVNNMIKLTLNKPKVRLPEQRACLLMLVWPLFSY